MKKKIAAAFALACLSTFAFAQGAAQQQKGSGWYLGINAGRTSTDVSDNDMASTAAYLNTIGITGIGYTKDESDTGYRAYVGFQINPNLGVEGGYANLGKFKAKFNGTFGGVAGNIAADAEAEAWFVDAVLSAPITREFTVFGKLGFNSLKADGTGSTTWPAVTQNVSQSETTSGGHFGVGASYMFNPQVGVRAEWERFSGAKISTQGSDSDIDMLSVGLQIRF